MSRESLLHYLEQESIYILREAASECNNPAMLYSAGKDSSVLLHLAQKAFYPGKIPFPLLHVDTTMKFQEMYTFRDQTVKEIGATLIVHTNLDAIAKGASPFSLGTINCCSMLKTHALLDALRSGNFDAAISGARRDEEKSRAKERVFSLRDPFGQWDPKNQRPEVWRLYNLRKNEGETFRVFPLSNWREMDIWCYIQQESIPIAPLYFAKFRDVVARKGQWILYDPSHPLKCGDMIENVMCRFRTLGCTPCTGAIESEADTIEKIIEELASCRDSERITRVIDHDEEGSMERKKREGYF